MWHGWRPDASLFKALWALDEKVAAETRAKGCTHCGGALHRADFPRKARGFPVEHEAFFARRFSACCGREGCRKRATPPSVRFAGRKIYAGFVVVIAPVLAAVGALLRAACDALKAVPARTVQRWRSGWSAVPSSTKWLELRARFDAPVDGEALPASLLARFGDAGGSEALAKMLQVVAPILPLLGARQTRVT
jgi:hypothetical protein